MSKNTWSILSERTRKRYYTQTNLMKRPIWNKKNIDTYLGEPDLIQKYEKVEGHANLKLYLKSRVEEVESQKWFQELLIKREKRNTCLKFVRSMSVRIKLLNSQVKLYVYACKHFNETATDKIVTLSDNISFLNKITVDALIDTSTFHKEDLDKLKEFVDTEDQYDVYLDVRTLEQIEIVYPFLKEECKTRMGDLFN